MAVIRDSIAAAEDFFPTGGVGSSVTDTLADLQTFTTETDDPQEMFDWYGRVATDGFGIAYTAWIKIVVPAGSTRRLDISSAGSTFTDSTFWVYDVVPTATSITPYDFPFDNDRGGDPNHELEEFDLAPGTYYVCFHALDDSWSGTYTPGTALTVTVTERSTTPILDSFGVEAIIRKTVTSVSPIYPTSPSLVGSNSAIASDANGITLTKPTGVQEGDLLLAILSMDMELVSTANWNSAPSGWLSTSPSTGMGAAVNQSGVGWDSRQQWYRKVATASEPADYTWGSNRQTDQVGVIVAVRDYAAWVTANWWGTNTQQFGHVTSHTARNAGPANGIRRIVFHALTGNDPAPHVWTSLTAGQTTIADVAAVTGVNMLVTYHIDIGSETSDGPAFIGHGATAPLGSTSIGGTVSIGAVPVPYLGLHAVIGLRRTFGLDALLTALPTATTHPRTGPHVGVHPDTVIVSSALLGSLPAGIDLHTVLADLDALLTDLENQA